MATDLERPLNARGRRAAPVMAAWLAGRGWHPELILCSSAARTQETLTLVRETLAPPRIRIEEFLYLASASLLRRTLERVDDSIERVMIIAHNPGLEDLARELASETGAASTRLHAKFPTAAMAWFRIDADQWRGCFRTAAMLVDFMTPGDIAGDEQD